MKQSVRYTLVGLAQSHDVIPCGRQQWSIVSPMGNWNMSKVTQELCSSYLLVVV